MKYCVTGDYGQVTQREIEVMMTISRAVYNDYKNLVIKAANGDEEAIGALAFEAGLFFLPIDEIRFASKLKARGGIPFGFKSSGQFRQFGTSMQAGLERAGYKRFKIIFAGECGYWEEF